MHPTLLSRLGVAALLLVLLPASAPGQVPPPPPPPPPPPGIPDLPPGGLPPPARDFSAEATGTSVLSGTVMAADASGRPVRRATVRILGSGLPGGRLLMTDEQGRFTFTGLPAGSYSLSVQKPGWVVGYYGSREPWTSPGTPVVVGEGQVLAGLDVRLAPGAVISGRIYDQFGKPQAGARVTALERRRYGGQDQMARARSSSGLTTTDDRGEYRIYGLPPGEFYVAASIPTAPRATTTLTTPEEVRWAEQLARGGLTSGGQAPPAGPEVGYAPVYYPGVTAHVQASAVTVGMGEERSGADFQLQFVTTASIRGSISMPDGSPARGAMLMMTPAGSEAMTSMMVGSLPLNRATVRPDGTFAFESVTPGDYFINARASSAPPARGRGAGPREAPVMDLWAGETVTLGNASIESLALRLQPGLTFSGRLAFEGTELEPPGNLTAASVRLVPAEQNGVSVSVSMASSTVSDDGAFTLPGVAPGQYYLSAGVPRGATGSDLGWFPHRAMVEGVNAVEMPVDIRPGRDIDGVIIEFTDRPASLSGQVTDSEGRPVQGLTMLLFRAEPEMWAGNQAPRMRRTLPLNSDGRFEARLMPAGEYYLAALAEVDQADLGDPAFLAQVAQSAIRVTLTLGQETVQDIRLGGG